MEYYRTKEGRYKRKIQNGKRRGPGKTPDEKAAPEAEQLNVVVVAHVRMAASLIEGRRVSLEEIVAMLHRVLRQRRLGVRRRIDYIVDRLKKRPP